MIAWREVWKLCPGDDDRGRLVPPKRLQMSETVTATNDESAFPRLSAENLTISEYLEFEENSPIKHEYIGGRVYAMAGASDAHNAITTNLVALLRPIVRGKRCRVYSSDMKLRIDDLIDLPQDKRSAFYYPDVMVVCSKGDDEKLFKRQPTILIEVLSASTEEKDRVAKLDHYKSIGTLQQYWLVSQDRWKVEVWQRSGLAWGALEFVQENDLIALAGLDEVIRLKDLYEDVTV